MILQLLGINVVSSGFLTGSEKSRVKDFFRRVRGIVYRPRKKGRFFVLESGLVFAILGIIVLILRTYSGRRFDRLNGVRTP